jgi:sugar phosphate permease
VPWLVGCVGAVGGGLVCDGLTRRLGIRWGCRWPSIIGLLLSGAFLALAGAAPDPYIGVVFLSLCLGFQQFTDSASWAATTSVGGEHASAACGVLNTGGNVVGGIVAILVPVTAQAVGWVAALATGSLFALLGAVLWFWIEADRPLVDGADRANPSRRLKPPFIVWGSCWPG